MSMNGRLDNGQLEAEANEIKRLKSINAELLAACKAAMTTRIGNQWPFVEAQIKAAIEKAKQGKVTEE